MYWLARLFVPLGFWILVLVILIALVVGMISNATIGVSPQWYATLVHALSRMLVFYSLLLGVAVWANGDDVKDPVLTVITWAVLPFLCALGLHYAILVLGWLFTGSASRVALSFLWFISMGISGSVLGWVTFKDWKSATAVSQNSLASYSSARHSKAGIQQQSTNSRHASGSPARRWLTFVGGVVVNIAIAMTVDTHTGEALRDWFRGLFA